MSIDVFTIYNQTTATFLANVYWGSITPSWPSNTYYTYINKGNSGFAYGFTASYLIWAYNVANQNTSNADFDPPYFMQKHPAIDKESKPTSLFGPNTSVEIRVENMVGKPAFQGFNTIENRIPTIIELQQSENKQGDPTNPLFGWDGDKGQWQMLNPYCCSPFMISDPVKKQPAINSNQAFTVYHADYSGKFLCDTTICKKFQAVINDDTTCLTGSNGNCLTTNSKEKI